MKKIIFLILLSFFFNFSLSFAEEEQKEMEGFAYIDFYDFITTYNVRNKNIVNGAYNNKKINLKSSSVLTYLEPAEKYITILEYRGSDRDIDIYQKPFLLDWFKIIFYFDYVFYKGQSLFFNYSKGYQQRYEEKSKKWRID